MLTFCRTCKFWEPRKDSLGLCNLTSSYSQPAWVEMQVPGPSLLMTSSDFFCKHGTEIGSGVTNEESLLAMQLDTIGRNQ